MKQSRRKELKTNELGEYLLQIYDWAARNANYLLGGAVVVVLVLGIGWVVHSNRVLARESAWIEYNELYDVGLVTPAHIERAESLVDRFGQTPDLGPRVTFLKTDLAYKRAMNLTGEDEQEQRVELLREAKDTLLAMRDLFAADPQVVAQIFMRLAAIEETLVLAGQGDRDQIRSFYQRVIDEKTAPYAEDASEQLETLDERLTILPLVASRPAEEPAIPITDDEDMFIPGVEDMSIPEVEGLIIPEWEEPAIPEADQNTPIEEDTVTPPEDESTPVENGAKEEG